MISAFEAEQILDDLCYTNGINFTELKATKVNDSVRCIEMFFNGFPQIIHMDKFPNLTELKIIDQELTTITGLETCLNLTDLWISECKLMKISGLKNCRNLKKLFLYSNKLTKIENLENLNLEVLWLCDNKISVIEGIDHMTELVELNLARNLIRKIGNSLKNLKNVEILNLSANLIENFQEITYLQNLPNLKNLCFKDPQYGQNPVTVLCNYSLYVIYHLPGLLSLDTLPISNKMVKELADSTINKKKLWYYMRLNTVKRELDEMILLAKRIKYKNSQTYFDQKSNINLHLKEIYKQLHILSLNKEQNESQISEKESLIKPLQEKLKEIEQNLNYIKSLFKKCLENLHLEAEVKKNFIIMELENGGNIRFDFSTSKNDGWSKLCHELITSRFCSSDYASKSINGIRIKRVFRVTNRVLIAKYEEKLLIDVDESDYINNKPSVRKKIEYLMYCWRNNFGSQKDELYHIIRNGFNDPSLYKEKGYEEAIPFTNNLYTSDINRMENNRKQSNSKTNNNLAYKNGYILLCKVYTNRIIDHTTGTISPHSYQENLGVKRRVASSASSYDENGDTKKCDCKTKQLEWYLFDKNIALPEYIIEYEYLNKYNSDNIFDRELSTLNVDKTILGNHADSDEENNEEEFDLESIVTEQIHDQHLRHEELRPESISELNLHNVGLTTFDLAALLNLKNLKKLIASFNKLTSISEIALLNNLEYLDVSYNSIRNLNEIKKITRVCYLDLSNNKIQDSISLCQALKTNFPILNYLDIDKNPIKKKKKIRVLLLYMLRSLSKLNKEPINDSERDFNENKLKLSPDLVKNNSHTIFQKPRSLNYTFITDLFTDESHQNYSFSNGNMRNELNYSLNSEFDFTPDVNNYFEKITVLIIERQSLLKLTNIDYLGNLKYASFNDNYLTRIEGIDRCLKLEELSLENNLLQSLNGLENLENLRKLNVNNNEIIYYDDLNNRNEISFKNWDLSLPRLNYLSISNNNLTSIKFASKLPSLIEFYASLNKVKNLREIFHLKNLNGLAILDLSSNPMAFDPKYRLFLIYHLKILKSLDGTLIESMELVESKDSFGGKLTCDFIAEKFTHSRLCDIRSLEFPQCSIRVVDLGPTVEFVAEQFESLRSLNLENNNLTSFSGLIYLKNLKILCLNNNKIDCLFPKQKSQNQIQNIPEQILPSLEVLHLAFNGINDLVAFQIGRLTSLKALFLQGNEITKIEGLDTLCELRELVLDKNKIKAIGEYSFVGQGNRLLELHMEENRIRDLNNIQVLKHLQKLYVANNKMNDYSDIEKLMEMNNLYEVSMINNPISRRPHYRITMVFKIKRLKILDMIEVSEDDRIKAEIYFCEQQQLQQQPQIYFNGLVQTTPQVIATQIQNQSTLNQLENQFMALSQSPRLKPITLLEKQYVTNPQILNNNTSNKKMKNQLDKLNKDYQTRYRN